MTVVLYISGGLFALVGLLALLLFLAAVAAFSRQPSQDQRMAKLEAAAERKARRQLRFRWWLRRRQV